MSVAAATVVAIVLLLPVAAGPLAEAFGAAVEFVSMEMLASMIFELPCPVPNVKREPEEENMNSCLNMIHHRKHKEITTNRGNNIRTDKNVTVNSPSSTTDKLKVPIGI